MRAESPIKSYVCWELILHWLRHYIIHLLISDMIFVGRFLDWGFSVTPLWQHQELLHNLFCFLALVSQYNRPNVIKMMHTCKLASLYDIAALCRTLVNYSSVCCSVMHYRSLKLYKSVLKISLLLPVFKFILFFKILFSFEILKNKKCDFVLKKPRL